MNADSPMELNPSLESSDEEEQLASGSGRCPSAAMAANDYASCGPGSTAQGTACASGSAAGSRRSAQLGLHFNSSYSGGRSPLSWRDGTFSDWTVQVGEKSYQLHAFLLARASMFFRSHMSFAAGTADPTMVGPLPSKKGSDLTEVLPLSCHSSFEDALDFVYSENQSAFEVPACKALLLLKVADILGIGGLFDAMVQRIQNTFSETAPLLMEQYCRVHVPGAEDGQALKQIRDEAVDLIVHKFQPFLAMPDMRYALVHLPSSVISEILEAEDLAVASEDVVFDFVQDCIEANASTAPSNGDSPTHQDSALADNEVVWQRVRWPHLSAGKFSQAMSLAQQHLRQEMVIHALMARVAQVDLGGSEAFSNMATPATTWMMPARQAILPPGVPQPLSTEIDFCFHYTGPEQYACGEAIRSQPKRIGDVVLRVLVFPSGTDTGVAKALSPSSWKLYRKSAGLGTGNLQVCVMRLLASVGRLDRVRHGQPSGKGTCGHSKQTGWTEAGMTSSPQERFTDTWVRKVSSVSEARLNLSACRVASCWVRMGPADLLVAAVKSLVPRQVGVHGRPEQQDLTADIPAATSTAAQQRGHDMGKCNIFMNAKGDGLKFYTLPTFTAECA
eukprot:CAMPEP_0172726820 /NCGR_PEP_ID=MMETSP1074-20121228/91329_1 /TAXON_ID=2916 /ORGANISM="Ceratium fusus, Strain PA161109" /LENGTH=616 /DNA_ID=CAMNT_0013553913 /DNA_START=34 /DNA_END=1886 /DNA_ORIENTATION=+